MKKFKIAICSLSIGEEYKIYTKYSRLNKIYYCEKHGYDFIEDDTVYDSAKTIPWSKINLILKYIDNYDYICWIDADMLIMNKEITIESLIKKYNKDIICGSDHIMINTGVLIVKNNEFSKQFLKQVYENREYEPESNPKYGNHEQGSFIYLFDNNVLNSQEHIVSTPPHEMNSYWYYYFNGHFIFHFAAVRGYHLMYEMNRFVPERMDEDTDESYEQRMKWLNNGFREEFDNALRR